MKNLPAHRLFQQMPAEKAASMLGYFRDEERQAYTGILASLAAKRRLRPVFIQRKKVDEQISWMIKTLQVPGCEESAQQMLELWLMKTQSTMMAAFLDALGVEHDGDGRADDIPHDLDADKVLAAMETLLKTHAAEDVTLYLHIFNQQQTGGWPAVEQALDDPRLGWNSDA